MKKNNPKIIIIPKNASPPCNTFVLNKYNFLIIPLFFKHKFVLIVHYS